MADVSHVVFHVRQWWTTHNVPLSVWVSSSNFGLIGCMISEILQFLEFSNLAWKCLFIPLLGGFLGGTLPPNNVTHSPNPQKIVLGLNHVMWGIKSKYRPRGSSWGLEEEKGQYRTGQEKATKGLCFTYSGRSPSEAIYIKNCLVGDLFVPSFKMKFSGVTILHGSNFAFSYWFLNGSYNNAALLRCLW